MTLISIIVIVVLFFYNALSNIISLPYFFKYWDEVIVIILLFYFLLTKVSKKKIKIDKRIYKCYFYILILIISGIISNLLFNYMNNFSAIFRDIIQFLKFPLTLLILKDTNLDNNFFNLFERKNTKIILKLLTIIIFVLGVLSLFFDIGLSSNSIRNGIRPYKFLFGHPTYLVLSSVMLICYFQAFSKEKKCIYFLLFCIVLSMRTKGLVFIALYFFIKYAGKWMKKFKILYWIIIIIIAYGASYEKLQLYKTYSTSARQVLYTESINFSIKNFPLGTGFASFGSHLSWKYNSRVYSIITIPFYSVDEGDETAVLGDAGYSYYIGQFGFLGIFIIILMSINLYKVCINETSPYIKETLLLIYLYILIALTSETILVNNGVELAILISAISCKKNDFREE